MTADPCVKVAPILSEPAGQVKPTAHPSPGSVAWRPDAVAIKDGRITITEFEPDLAESWTTSRDGTQGTFRLRRGVQFHKGFGEITVEDVKFSFERQIKGASGTRFGVNLEAIKSIEVIDPHTVQISLMAYDPLLLLRVVGYQRGYIVSKKAVEKAVEQYEWNPVGSYLMESEDGTALLTAVAADPLGAVAARRPGTRGAVNRAASIRLEIAELRRCDECFDESWDFAVDRLRRCLAYPEDNSDA